MKKRVISAIVALLIAVPLIYLGGPYFFGLVLVVGSLGYKEMVDLFIKKYSIKIVGYLCFLTILLTNLYDKNFNFLIDYKIFGIIFLVFAMLALYNHKNKDFDVAKSFYLLGVTLFLGLSFSIIIITRNISLVYFIYLFSITFFTDTFAQTIGVLSGKHKINEISPNKSWEGFIGGTFFGVLSGSLFYLILINTNVGIFKIIMITFALSVLGQLGDLFFSLIKRNYNIKDFSNIMPGHGGILDRLDSIIFVMLAFTYFITLL